MANVQSDSLSQDDVFMLFEIMAAPATIRQRSTSWLERMLRLCHECGEAETLFNAIGAELLHRRGR